jgi:hypothetical protein
MMLAFAPALFSICGEDAASWLTGLTEWNDLLAEIDLAPILPEGHWEASQTDGTLPTFEAVTDYLGTAGLKNLAGSAVQVLASVLSRSRQSASSIALSDWTATGCFAAPGCPATKAAMVSMFVEQEAHDLQILGSRLNDEEQFHADYLRQDGSAIEQASLDFGARCVPTPAALVPLLDPADYWRRPAVAIRIALSQGAGTYTPGAWQVLPQLTGSLEAATTGIRRDAIRALAMATLPLAQRPAGLDEHPLREGSGPGSPQLQSRHGKAYRATVRKHGLGWRVHYWRGPGGVTMSNLSPHSSTEIYS